MRSASLESCFARLSGSVPFDFIASAHLGSTSYEGFSNSHLAKCFNCGAFEPTSWQTKRNKGNPYHSRFTDKIINNSTLEDNAKRAMDYGPEDEERFDNDGSDKNLK